MAQPLSSLRKGIKFASTAGTDSAPLLENLTLVLGTNTDLLATATGGALLTINPDRQTTAKTVTLLEGAYVDIALEFNGAGQFRVKVTPGSDVPTVSAWMAEQTEHNIGVSYNTTLGQIVLAVDGVSTQTYADFSSADASTNLKIAAPGNGAAAGPGTYDGFIDQLALFKSAPTVAQIEKMTGNPDLLRTDFATLDVPTVGNSTQGVNSRSETQTVVLTGTVTATGTVSFLGTATASVALGANATVVGDAIVAAKAAIIAGAGNTFGVTDITNNAGTLTLTFNASLGNVASITASTTSNGITFGAGAEVTSGVTVVSETQTVAITGPATATGVVSYLGVDSASVAASADATAIGNAIVTNKNAIMAGTAAKALNITDISNNAGTLTITFSGNAGDVADLAAITTASNGVIFASGTEVTKGVTGIAEAHTVTLAGTYHAGDVISIVGGIDSSGTTETKTYTVLSSDIKSTDSLTRNAVAASISSSFSNKLGGYTVANSSNTVTFTGLAGAGNLADPVVTYTGAGGLIENVVQDYFDFTKISISANSLTGPGAGTASFLNGKTTPSAYALMSEDYVSSNSSNTTVSTTALPTNGPVYARLKSYTTPGGANTAPVLKYEFFVNKSADVANTLTSLGFSLDFDETKATYTSFVAGSGATLQQVNTLDALGSGKVVYQWVSSAGQTDFSLPVGELTLTMAGTAPFTTTSVGMTMTDISINNTFYKQTGTSVPLVVDTKLDAERYTATGWVKQMFTPYANNTTAQVPVAQTGTVVSYEVFGAQTNPAVKLDMQDSFVATSRAAPNASVNLDVIANQTLSSFSMVINLPSNASGAVFNAGAGMTLTRNVVSGTQLSIAGTYVAPSTGASSTPTIGTVSMTLVGEHGTGSDFTISDLTVNNTVSVGRSLYFGVAESDTSGLLSLNNLPKGDLVTHVFDNPVAASSKITIEDARAVLLMAAGKNNGATANAVGNAWLPSDYIAADWDHNGVVTATDALAILNYVVAVDKSATQLDYVYIDNALNNLTSTPERVSSVVVPPIAKIATNKSNAVPPVDFTFGAGHDDVKFVGILVGDLVQ